MNGESSSAIPYWALALATFFDIISIWFDRNINTEKDIAHRLNRIRLSIIPKMIFVVIYTWFASDMTVSPEIRALHGRNAIFILMSFDFFIHFTNIIDSNLGKIKDVYNKIMVNIGIKIKIIINKYINRIKNDRYKKF